MLLTFSTSVMAQTTITNKATYLKKGEHAPYDGYHFTEDTTLQIQMELINKDHLEKENDSLRVELQFKDMEIDGLERRVEIHQKEVDKLIRKNNTNKWLYIGLGVLGTSLAVMGAGQLR